MERTSPRRAVAALASNGGSRGSRGEQQSKGQGTAWAATPRSGGPAGGAWRSHERGDGRHGAGRRLERGGKIRSSSAQAAVGATTTCRRHWHGSARRRE